MIDIMKKQNHYSRIKRLWKVFCSRVGVLRAFDRSLAGGPLAGMGPGGQYLALGRQR
jgi:hypothetical protein